MGKDIVFALSPLLGLFVDVVAQAVGARMFGVGRSIAFGAVVGFAATAVLTGFVAPVEAATNDAVCNWIVEVLTFISLAFGYWMFLNLNITSLRIRLLRELPLDGSGLTIGDVRARYPTSEILDRRLERLHHSGQMIRIEGRWHLRSPTLLLLVRIMECLRFFALPSRARLE